VHNIGADSTVAFETETQSRNLPMLRWLSELTDKDSAEVGPKIARLGTLRASGIEVPDGFAVTTTAFERFLTGTISDGEWSASWSRHPNIDNLVELEVGRFAWRTYRAGGRCGTRRSKRPLRDAYDELCFRHGE